MKDAIANVSSVRWPFIRANALIRSDEGLTLETSAIVSFRASITLINTQLIHQFVEDRSFAETRSPE